MIKKIHLNSIINGIIFLVNFLGLIGINTNKYSRIFENNYKPSILCDLY
jgi:hypothetical protein